MKFKLKKETIKENGKACFDIAKVLIAVAIVAPLVKDEGKFSIFSFVLVAVFAVAGNYLFDQGVEDDN